MDNIIEHKNIVINNLTSHIRWHLNNGWHSKDERKQLLTLIYKLKTNKTNELNVVRFKMLSINELVCSDNYYAITSNNEMLNAYNKLNKLIVICEYKIKSIKSAYKNYGWAKRLIKRMNKWISYLNTKLNNIKVNYYFI